MTKNSPLDDTKLSGERTIHSACSTRFAFETNGHQGGDGGHGGYLTITIEEAGGGMEAKVAGDTLVLRFAGDAEISNAMEGLRWLSRQIARAVDALPDGHEEIAP